MDIAGMSMNMSSAKVVQQASLLMAKNAMDLQETQAAGLVEMMQSAAPKVPGQLLNIRA